MATRGSGRARVAPVYDERALSRGAGSGGPAWAREQEGAAAKENSAPAGAGRRSEGGRKPARGAGAGDKGRPARKSAPAVAQKGRDAGLERLPIEDAKPAAKSAGAARLRSHEQAEPAAAGKQAFPGGPVVKATAAGKPAAAKAAAPAAAAAAGAGTSKAAAAAAAAGGSKAAGSSKAAAAAAAGSSKAAGGSKGKPASKSAGGGSKSGGAANAGPAAQAGGSGGKRKAVAPPAAEDDSKAAAKPGGNAPAASGADAKRHKAENLAPAAAQQQQQQRASQRGPAAAQAGAVARGAAGAAAAAAAAAAPVPGEDALAALGLQLEPAPSSGAEELVEHFSANFRALHTEYLKLQALYEDLKAAKIDEEVQQLLEQQNRHVTEHGQKAAQLVEHYKAEAAQHAAVAAELGGEALVEQCRALQADLTNCQQALLDKEVESLEKDRQLAALQARLAFLERYARVYETSDKCIQTDLPPRASASAQFPSLQSSGVEMLQAHAMVPEGAGGGSMYNRAKQGGPQVPDPSYTLPGLTPLPPGAAAATAATAAVGGRSPLAAATAAAPANSPRAAGAAPAAALLSGSDMQLTGTDEAQPQLQHVAVQVSPLQQQQVQPQQRRQSLQPALQQPAQQPRRQSLQPVAGRMAHAAAGPAMRPASAESQMHPAPAAGRQQQQQRRQSAVPVRAPAAGAAAGGSRRLSAPPAPVDRELQFGSTSTVAGQQALAPLPLEAVPEELPLEEAAEEAAVAGAAAQQAQRSPQQAQQPAASQVTAAGAGGPLVRVTLSAVPQATPASVPAPPRELALSRLTGLTSTPLKGGIYEFTDPRFGYVFQLGPASPDSADLRQGQEGPTEPELCYRPIALGAAGALLPEWFHEELKFVESQRNNFFIQMMDALARK